MEVDQNKVIDAVYGALHRIGVNPTGLLIIGFTSVGDGLRSIVYMVRYDEFPRALLEPLAPEVGSSDDFVKIWMYQFLYDSVSEKVDTLLSLVETDFSLRRRRVLQEIAFGMTPEPVKRTTFAEPKWQSFPPGSVGDDIISKFDECLHEVRMEMLKGANTVPAKPWWKFW